MAEASGVRLLIGRSAVGDEQAWNELVRRYAPLVMAVIRSYRLAAADSQDVSQTVWLRLVEHLARIREPEALPGWLVTTTQRECGRYVRQGDRVRPVNPLHEEAMQQATAAGPDARIIQAELHQALREGLAELPARDQQLLRLRTADPPLSYQEIGKLLGMRVGSIGPTLRRSLDKLRKTGPVRAYLGVNQVTDGETGGDKRELAQAE
jgi:RNA polymerase sigma factor (sigma-70 family)